jgi:S-formylglutathione hydrolase FrmB
MRSTLKSIAPILLTLWSLTAFGQALPAAKVEALKFESKLVGAPLPYNVVLPLDYAEPASKSTRYPVLYLLHGLGGSGNDWVSNRSHLTQFASAYDIIIVTPEGHDGWYTDSATVPTDKYESYLLQELIPDVDSRFRNINSRDGRAIGGLSMGGYGALKFGLKYPEKFVFAASMSGALQAASFDQSNAHLPAFVKPSISRVYGAMDTPTRASNDIYKLVETLPEERRKQLPYFYLDCGTEDGLVEMNRDFSALLLKGKIPHEFRELPGTHSWPYWEQQVQEVLRIAAKRLAPPQTAAMAK